MSGSVSGASSASAPSAQDLQAVEETVFEAMISLGGSIQNQEQKQTNDAMSDQTG